MCESRWLTSKPQRMARSIWARHSRRTSSRSAWSHTSSIGAGEAAVAVEQRGGVGDRAPAVEVVLGVEREVHADVLAPVARGRLARPRARAPSAWRWWPRRRGAPRRRRRWRRGSSPRSSQLTISRRASGAWPRRSARDVTVRRYLVTHRGSRSGRRSRLQRPRPLLAGRRAAAATNSSAWATLGGTVSDHGVAVAHERQVDEEVVARPGRRRRAAGRSGRAPRRRARAAPRCPWAAAPWCGPRPPRRSTRTGRARVHRLGRVDADQAHPLLAALDAGPGSVSPSTTRATVAVPGAAGAERAPPPLAAARTHGERDHDAEHDGAPVERAASPSIRCSFPPAHGGGRGRDRGTLRRARGWCRCRGRRRSTW